MSKIEPFRAYQIYLSLKTHFSSETYVSTKYNFKVKASSSSFYKRKDLYQFTKLSKRFRSESEIINFYVSHMVKDITWIGEMDDEIWNEFRNYHEALSYNFEKELKNVSEVFDTFDELFKVREESPFPLVIDLFNQNQVSLEFVTILFQLTNFLEHVNMRFMEDLVLKIKKYSYFVDSNRDKIRNIVLKCYS